jgi:hypothetical protein
MADGLLLIAATALLAVLAIMAQEFGADSRDGYGDDHAATVPG